MHLVCYPYYYCLCTYWPYHPNSFMCIHFFDTALMDNEYEGACVYGLLELDKCSLSLDDVIVAIGYLRGSWLTPLTVWT